MVGSPFKVRLARSRMCCSLGFLLSSQGLSGYAGLATESQNFLAGCCITLGYLAGGILT